MLLAVVALETQRCYWNRKNGHSLVGVFMVNGSESGKSENVFMFYDYDPKTNIMTPDMDVCKVVEKVALDKTFDDYALELPQEGKDIVVNLYSDDEENSYDMTEMTLKWTGDTFTLVADGARQSSLLLYLASTATPCQCIVQKEIAINPPQIWKL